MVVTTALNALTTPFAIPAIPPPAPPRRPEINPNIPPFFLPPPLPPLIIPSRVLISWSCRSVSSRSFSRSASSIPPLPPLPPLSFAILIFMPITVAIACANALTAFFAFRPLSANLENPSIILNIGSSAGPVSNPAISFIKGVS